MLSLSSTATSGRVAISRFAKTALLVTLASVDAAVSEAVVASQEASVLAEVLAVAAALTAALEDVEDLAEAMVVRLEAVSTPTVLPTPRTPSPTSLRQGVNPAT